MKKIKLSPQIAYKSYSLPNLGVTLTKDIITGYIKLFWGEIFNPLSDKGVHLMLIIKVESEDSSVGYRSLADVRKVNFTDKDIFTDFIVDRLGLLSDSYRTDPVTKIIFSYVVRDGLADDSRLLLKDATYQVTTHSFNNLNLPISMDPSKYGEVFSIQETTEFTKYAVSNKNLFFHIESKGNVNVVKLSGAADIQWIDTKIDDNTFKREIGKILFILGMVNSLLKKKFYQLNLLAL